MFRVVLRSVASYNKQSNELTQFQKEMIECTLCKRNIPEIHQDVVAWIHAFSLHCVHTAGICCENVCVLETTVS